MPALRRLPRAAAALALGTAAVALTVLAHPPLGAWPLAFAMLAPVAAFAEGRRARAVFAFVYLYSVVMALVIVRWLVHALAVEYGVPAAAAWTFAALLVGAYAVVPAGFGAAYALLRPRVPLLLAPALFGALWALGEWLRAGPLGLPWVLAGQPLAFQPLAIQTADLGGVHLPGFGVALAGAGLGLAAAARSPRPLLLPAALLAAGAAYGGWRLAELPRTRPDLRVGVVQAAVPQAQRFRPGSAARNTLRHVELTRRLVARARPDVVVWSETAVDDELDRAPALRAELRRLVARTGIPLVTGAPRADGGRRRNSVLLLHPDGTAPEVYDKQRLVPFSESEPAWLAWLDPLLGPVVAGDPYVPGGRARILDLPGARLATPICFEITYPDLMRRFRAAGAELFLNLSNDAWFGRTGFARTHLAHAPFRAVELRSWIVRATNTGLSAVVDPAGRVSVPLGLFEEGTFVAEVGATPPVQAPPYARYGDAPVVVFLLGVVAAARAAGAGARPRS